MQSLQLLLANLIGAIVLGGVMVATPIPLNVIALVFWVVLLYHIVSDHARATRTRDAVLAAATQLTTMAVVIAVAAFAPVKVTDRLMKQPVTIAKTEMTLAELNEYCQLHRRGDLPIRIGVEFHDADSKQTVRWSEERMTLRQFIVAVESQTPLRHRFSGCGNGWTILWGNDCSFGLRMEQPPSGDRTHRSGNGVTRNR